MKLKDILSISGKGGLYKYISQARNGIIVESFEDGKRVAVHSTAKVSALEDIAIFTEKEEIPLAEIFKKIYEKEGGNKTIDHKSPPEELKNFMESILPDYDRDRVYVSDMKKLVLWYNILISHKLLKPEEEEKESEKEKEKEDKSKDIKEKATAKEKQIVKKQSKPQQVKTTKASPSVKSVPRTTIPRAGKTD